MGFGCWSDWSDCPFPSLVRMKAPFPLEDETDSVFRLLLFSRMDSSTTVSIVSIEYRGLGEDSTGGCEKGLEPMVAWTEEEETGDIKPEKFSEFLRCWCKLLRCYWEVVK